MVIRNTTELLQLGNAPGASRILLSANDLDLFTVLGTQDRTAEQIANRCKSDVQGTQLLLDALVSLGLLQVTRRGYRNTALGRLHLDRRSPQAITNLLWLLGHHWHDWTKLPQALRKGRPGRAPVTATPGFRKRFSLAMHERSHVLATPTVRSIHLPSPARRFLDLGGGPGSYAIALAKRYRSLSGVIMDQSVTVAKKLVRQSHMADRLTVVSGDILSDDLGAGYDVVLCSNVIHIFNEIENRRLLRRAAHALRPGGKLFIVEFFLDDGGTSPPKATVFSVMMWLYTATGRCYSWGEVEGWLKTLGFGKFKRRRVTADIGTLEATKG